MAFFQIRLTQIYESAKKNNIFDDCFSRLHLSKEIKNNSASNEIFVVDFKAFLPI